MPTAKCNDCGSLWSHRQKKGFRLADHKCECGGKLSKYLRPLKDAHKDRPVFGLGASREFRISICEHYAKSLDPEWAECFRRELEILKKESGSEPEPELTEVR